MNDDQAFINEAVIHSFSTLYDDVEKVLGEIYDVTREISEDKVTTALSLIKTFDHIRHELIGSIFTEHLQIYHGEEATVYSLINIISGYLDLSQDDKIKLQQNCDTRKTPDGLHINTRGSKIISIIDFKGGFAIELARRETRIKYEKALVTHLRNLNVCDVEVLIMGLNPRNGEYYMDVSLNEELNTRFNSMMKDETAIKMAADIMKVSNIFSTIKNAYSRFESFTNLLNTKDVLQVPTEGYFTKSIPPLMDRLFSGSNGYDYTYDDVFRLSPSKANYVRLYLLLTEFYDYPSEDNNLLHECFEIINWLEKKNGLGVNVKKAYYRLRETDKDFNEFCTLIKQSETNCDRIQLYQNIDRCRSAIKKTLNNLYDSEVDNEVHKLMNIKKEDLSDFQPREPRESDLDEGLNNCIQQIKDDESKVFIHVGKAQQPFNYFFPTDSGADKILSLNKISKAPLNDCKLKDILAGLKTDKNTTFRFRELTDHWIQDVDNFLSCIEHSKNHVTLLSRCRDGPDEAKTRQEFNSLMKIINQGLNPNLTINDWVKTKEISKFLASPKKNALKEQTAKILTKSGKTLTAEEIDLAISNDKALREELDQIHPGVKIIPGTNVFQYKNLLTDGDNHYIGRKKAKYLKKLNIYQDCTGTEPYLLRAGVALKKKKQDLEEGMGIITINDLKNIDELQDQLKESNYEHICIKDTRTRVLDYNCEDCKICADTWSSWLYKISSTVLDKPINTKLHQTIDEIIQSKSHNETEGVRDNVKERLKYFYKSPAFYIANSISQLFEGLMVKSNFNKIDTLSTTLSNSTDTVLVKFPGEKLFNPKKNVPFIFIKRVYLTDLTKDYIRNSVLLDLMNTDYIINNGDSLCLISRPQRLDLNRINTLSKSEMRLALACSVFCDTYIEHGTQVLDKIQMAKLIGNSFRLALTVSISQMSLRDPLKYLFTLAIADASDLKGFLTEKFKYHLKSVSDLQLFNDIIKLIRELIIKRPEIKSTNQVKQMLTITEDSVLEGGWSNFDVISPFTGRKYRDIKQLVNEILVNVYFVQKELHNPITNLEKLVEVPCEFEIELKKHLLTGKSDDLIVREHRKSHKCKGDCDQLLTECLDRFFFTKQTLSGSGKFSYNPIIVMLSGRKRMATESFKAEMIRPKIEGLERIKSPMVMIDTLTSSKSSTNTTDTIFKQCFKWEGNFDNMSINHNKLNGADRLLFNLKRLTNRATSEVDNIEKITDLSVIKQRITLWSAIYVQITNNVNSEILKRIDADLYKRFDIAITLIIKRLKLQYRNQKMDSNSDYVFNEDKFTQKIAMYSKNGFIKHQVSNHEYSLFCRNTMDEYVISDTIPVKEALYELIDKITKICQQLNIDIDRISVVDFCTIINYLNAHDINRFKLCSIIRMFPKGQRTFTDREIYIMDILTKIRLYYVEHSYKHINRINDYEAISMPGEAKSYFISKQEIGFLIGNSSIGLEVNDEDRNRLINHLNADESKWSARDNPIKFMDTHLAAICSKPSERLMMIAIELDCMIKIVTIPEIVMQRRTIQESKRLLEPSDKSSDAVRFCTNGYKRNFAIITFNWLQGNKNYVSSFVHTSVMQFSKDVHELYFKKLHEKITSTKYNNITNFESMVHSDDAAISTAVVMDTMTHRHFIRIWDSYARFMFYVTKRLKQYFCITLNLLKTFCSEAIKDFISEFLVNGEFIGNYSRFIVNCCGDSNFKSFKEDISMLMAGPQSMAKRGSTLETLLISVAVVNYHVYHTYSMAAGEINDPMKSMALVDLIKTMTTDQLNLLQLSPDANKTIEEIKTLQILKVTKFNYNRNQMMMTLGGYCNPPLQLLALLGSKAHDAYIMMESFKLLMETGLFREALNKPEHITEIGIKVTIETMKKNPILYPDLTVLVGTYLMRQELGCIQAKYSKYDMQRINHANLFTFPVSKNEELYPVKYKSYNDFLNLMSRDFELAILLKSIISESYNITGVCKTTTQFKSRMKLDYQVTKKIDVYQTATTAIQRLNRLITTNKKNFLPVNLLDGLEKIKISESLKSFSEDHLGLIDSQISVCRGEVKAYELKIAKQNRLELMDNTTLLQDQINLKLKKKRLQELEQSQRKYRLEHDKDIMVARTGVKRILYLLSELSTHKGIAKLFIDFRSQNLDITDNYEHESAIKKLDKKNQKYYSYIENYVINREYYSSLRCKLRLNEAIAFMVLLSTMQSTSALIESYIYSLMAVVFNDKLLNFFLKSNTAAIRKNVEGHGTATIQMVVYPYQIKQLTYRAEDVVKCALMNEIEVMDYKNLLQIDEPTFNNDMAIVKKIIIDLELTDTIEDLKSSIDKFRSKRLQDNDVYELLTVIKRYNVIYNILLKTISVYNTKQAYTLSRARSVDSAHHYFENYKGNFIKSEIYVGMMTNNALLKKYNLDIITEYDESIKSTKRILDAVTSVIEKCQRLMSTNFGPVDIIEILENSDCGKKQIWSYLQKMKDKINLHLYDLNRYLPILYHLGLIGEDRASMMIQDNEVGVVWLVSHSVRQSLKGVFSVEYRYRRIVVKLLGVDRQIKQMIIFKDHIYDDYTTEGYILSVNLSKIFDKIIADFRFRLKELPTKKYPGMIYASKRKYNLKEYHITDLNTPNADWSQSERREFGLMFYTQDLQYQTQPIWNSALALVDFYQMDPKYKSMLNLCYWIPDILTIENIDQNNSIDKVPSVLYGIDVPYLFSVPHNTITMNKESPFLSEVTETQYIIIKNIRAKPERFTEIELLKRKDIVINGLNLRILLETLRDIEDTQLNFSQMTREKLGDLIPSLKPIMVHIEAIARYIEEPSLSIANDMVETVNMQIQDTLKQQFKSVIQLIDLSSREVDENIYKTHVSTSIYETLMVNILERFSVSTLNFGSVVSILIGSIYAIDNMTRVLPSGRHHSKRSYLELKSNDETVEDLLRSIVALLLHLNNLNLIRRTDVLVGKVNVSLLLTFLFRLLVSISYLHLLEESLKGDNTNILINDIMGLFKTKLARVIHNGEQKFLNESPSSVEVVGKGTRWGEQRTITYDILTSDNLKYKESGGRPYLAHINVELYRMRNMFEGIFLQTEDLVHVDKLITLIEHILQ